MRFHLKSIVAVFALMLAASPMAGAVDLILNGGFEMNVGVGQLGVSTHPFQGLLIYDIIY